jgi:UDP-N-acetylmuramate: L-alanyl-gamma-D-glutamyl-meso-diaminopimelate ligase
LKYHLIAIGGTGMGALAGLLRAAGHQVRGSDENLYPPMSDQLAALDITVYSGFSPQHLDWGPDVVVVGNVCRKDHVEVVEAQARGIPLASFPQVLGERFLADKRSLVVTGTHGKTTTTSLLGQILLDAERDPGIFVGGVPLNMGRGWRYGHGGEFVVEGDEYDSAFFDKSSKFLHYRPHMVILTSVELDHVDIFASMEDVREVFRKLVALVPPEGLLIVCASSPEALAIAQSHAKCTVETYAVERNEGEPTDDAQRSATWVARNLTYTRSGRCRFELRRNGELFDRYETLLAGGHNVANNVAAIAVASSLGIAPNSIRRSVAEFAGVARRQEVVGVAQGVYVIDDYAHHPTAVTETLRALHKRFPQRRIMAIYEPRSATSRRKTFQREYVKALSHADAVVVGRMHDPSRIPREERFDPEGLALELHRGRTPATYIESVDDIVAHTMGWVRPGDVVVVLSSGSFDGLHKRLLAALGDSVRPATHWDMAGVREVVQDLGWHMEDFSDEAYRKFYVLHNETGLVGCVALEVYGEAAILRSLAVKKEARGIGYGWLLAETAVTMARHRGIKRIYLLTENASDFFAAKLGFRIVDISTVSPAVANSSTFRDRHHGATAMRLDL